MTALGLVLILTGTALLVAEAHLTSGGLLGIAGTLAAATGTAIAVDAAGGGLALALVLALLVAAVAGAAVVFAARAVARSARGRVRSGAETLVGARGRARGAIAIEGPVLVDGAIWSARNGLPQEPIQAGDPVVVERVSGLTLTVRRAESWELEP